MNEQLLERVLQSPRLPSLPTIALEVIALVQRKNVDIKQIADTITHDPALSSKILKTVNSSFYGQAYAIGTVSHALVVLGLNSVKTLALGFSLVSNLADQGGEDFDHMAYWKRSLFTATASRALAQRAGLVQQEEAFLGGLLQDLGVLTMNQTLGRRYGSLIASTNGIHSELLALETALLDLDHCTVGAKLADSWSLPPLLVEAIRHHHDPDAAGPDTRKVVQCVALGNLAADVFMLGEADRSGPALEAFRTKAAAWFNLSSEEAEPLLKEIHKLTRDMQRLFELPTGGLGDFDDILASANDALLHLSMQAQQQTSRLRQEAADLQTQYDHLAIEANTDKLTGVANRRAFDGYIAEQFPKAGTDAPLSVMFLDIDRFKLFNDTHGHALGDQALVAFAQTLEEVVGDKGRVHRYGGEEFAVICPGLDRKAAAQLAEHVRKTVEDRCKVARRGGGSLGVTCSIGVACQEGQTFRTFDQLVKASDQGVYAAKQAGRNAVRVFTPRARGQAAA